MVITPDVYCRMIPGLEEVAARAVEDALRDQRPCRWFELALAEAVSPY
jgi:hypothetical protein